MSIFFEKILKINRLIFSFVVGLSFFLILLESYKYSGFLGKHIFIDARSILILVLISSFFVIGKKLNTLNTLVFKVNIFVLPMLIFSYLAMQFLEATHFHNYVFSTYHFQPEIFFYVVFMSLTLFFVSSLNSENVSFLKVSIPRIALVIIFIMIFFDGISNTMNLASYRDMYILSHINDSYDTKMSVQIGVYYDYIKFVKVNTQQNSSILVPPQQAPWFSSGNVGMDRYFLFPRNLGNGNYDEPLDLTRYDYVLLVWGEWGNDENDFAWPKVTVKAEKIIFFDPVTHVTKEVNGDYNPKLSRENGNWGLIKIRK